MTATSESITVSQNLVSIIALVSGIRLPTTFPNIPSSQTRLDALLLRLTRIGLLAGLVPSPVSKMASEPALEIMSDNLIQLLTDLELKKEECSFFLTGEPHNPSSSLPAPEAKLHSRARSIAKKRATQLAKSWGYSTAAWGQDEWIVPDTARLDFVLGWAAETLGACEAALGTASSSSKESRQICNSEIKEIAGEGSRAKAILGSLLEAVQMEPQDADEMLWREMCETTTKKRRS